MSSETNPAGVRPLAILAAVFCILGSAQAGESVEIPTGQTITPDAANGAIFQDLNPGHPEAPDMRAGQAAAEAISPDGRMLAILTSGYNVYFGADGKAVPELSTEYVFLFDITGPAPKQVQVLSLQNTFEGLAWAPSSDRLYVSGGSDDSVHEFVRSGAKFEQGRVIKLGHDACVGLNLPSTPKYWTGPTANPVTRRCGPVVSSLAVSPDGTRLLAANFQDDSVSLVDLASGRVVAEQDLRPGIIDPKDHGRPGGSFPRSVAWSAPNRAYVASERDREIISLRVSGDRMRVEHRVAVRGQPMAVIANRAGSRVYAALDTASGVAVINTASDKLVETFDATAPEEIFDNKKILGGANTDALALTPDERTLLVSNGGQNAVAVVHLSARARGIADDRSKAGDDDDRGPDRSAVMGLVPTGRYPSGVATSKDGATWYVVNFKSDTGPNAVRCAKNDSAARNCLPDAWVARTGDTKNIFDDSRTIVAAQNRQEMRL
ncbi:MAG TPA: hypothetical protein VKB71_06780, partial [Rhizomicrobium sp.]|nr:hypothetical protein [Rhizomicrobium sp.]